MLRTLEQNGREEDADAKACASLYDQVADAQVRLGRGKGCLVSVC